MIVLRGHPFEWEVSGPTAVTVGVFDGVHVGHQLILTDLVTHARKHGLLSSVVTFDPHPLRFLAPERAPLMLTSVEQRIEQFRKSGELKTHASRAASRTTLREVREQLDRVIALLDGAEPEEPA